MIGLLYRLKDNRDVDVFTVHEKPGPSADRIERAADLVFVRDGFSWLAAIVPAVYFLTRARWASLGIYLVAVSVLAGALAAAGAPSDWSGVAVLAFNALVGFEAANIERKTLELKGWKEIATVTGKNRVECERRFFERWMSEGADAMAAAADAAKHAAASDAPARGPWSLFPGHGT